MYKKIVAILLLFLLFPTVVNAQDSITIKGDLFDQRADYNIFNGAMHTDNNYNDNIVTPSLNSNLKPIFSKYNFYSNANPLYTDRWFNDYGYNPLQRIKDLTDSFISNQYYSSDLRKWAYKAMYLSLEAASKIVIETKATIGNNSYLLSNNADYIYSLTRVERLLKDVSDNLKINSNAYNDIVEIDNSLISIFNSYTYPEDKMYNYYYKASNIIFPDITLPSDFDELNTIYNTLINSDINKQMVSDNTTKFYLNIKKSYSLELIKNEDGMYEYDSNKFFIADRFGIGEDLDPNNETNYFYNNYGEGHNYLFTYMFKLQINPQKNDVFTFTGDDDVWVYLSEKDNPSNNKLIINLGGIHASQSSSFKFVEGENGLLNCIVMPRESNTYNLTPLLTNLDSNKQYNIHLFFSERRPEGSNFKIVTNVAVLQSEKPELESNVSLYNSPTTASVKLKKQYNDETVFRLYNSLGNETSNLINDITNKNINLLFDETPKTNETYYLTAQNPNETESDKVPIEVNTYTIENPKTSYSIDGYYFLCFASVLFIYIFSKKIIKH